MFWGLAVLSLSGDIGSDTHTLHLLHWLLSRFMTIEPAQVNPINFWIRKTGHALAYGGMYFLWFRAFRGSEGYGTRRACLWSLGFCLLFSLADEGRQWFHPSRGASGRDVLLDMCGASLAALVTGAAGRPALKPPINPG